MERVCRRASPELTRRRVEMKVSGWLFICSKCKMCLSAFFLSLPRSRVTCSLFSITIVHSLKNKKTKKTMERTKCPGGDCCHSYCGYEILRGVGELEIGLLVYVQIDSR